MNDTWKNLLFTLADRIKAQHEEQQVTKKYKDWAAIAGLVYPAVARADETVEAMWTRKAGELVLGHGAPWRPYDGTKDGHSGDWLCRDPKFPEGPDQKGCCPVLPPNDTSPMGRDGWDLCKVRLPAAHRRSGICVSDLAPTRIVDCRTSRMSDASLICTFGVPSQPCGLTACQRLLFGLLDLVPCSHSSRVATARSATRTTAHHRPGIQNEKQEAIKRSCQRCPRSVMVRVVFRS